jgi:hypothetical protein
VPNITTEVHKQWRSYNGFTWAFKPYMDVGLVQYLDTPQNVKAMSIIDPANYWDRLAKIPKLITVTSDDEFMQMDWTQLYWDDVPGEKHLLISPNTEHICVTGLPTILGSIGTFLRSLAEGHTQEHRPVIEQEFDEKTGIITVKIPEQKAKIARVKLHYGETLQSERRDFRWVIEKPESGCKLPYIPVPQSTKNMLKKKYPHLKDDDGQCIQPIIWKSHYLHETKRGSRTYVGHPPIPKKEGHWTGYYISVYFEGDTQMDYPSIWPNEYHITSKGYTYPNEFPFPDCQGDSCKSIVV